MADPQQLEILKSRVQEEWNDWPEMNLRSGNEKWNSWRKEHPEVTIDLSMADFHGADLSWADLSKANLRGADLSGANLAGVDLSDADLSEANLRVDLSLGRLRGANLSAANLLLAHLSWADLSKANLSGADLSKANLSGADLRGADLTKAVLDETVFGNVDLGHVTGLDSCQHSGPSLLDHRTLSRSGTLPLVFLRGTGLPDNLIDYLPSLLGSAVQFYSCFISYSTQDQDFADRLHADLQNKGVRCWFAPHKIQGGKKVHEQIDEAIRLYDRLLLILSEDSMKSNWVKTEIDHAVQKERNEGRKVLFPISIVPFANVEKWKNFNADVGKDLAKEIREYFIPDFSQWKEHDSYTQAFERLLRDLKAI